MMSMAERAHISILLIASSLSLHLCIDRISSGKPHGIDGVDQISEGVNFSVGSKELEVDHPVSRGEFLSGSCFGSNGFSSPVQGQSSSASAKQYIPLRPKAINSFRAPAFKAALTAQEKQGVQLEPVSLVSSAEQRGAQPKVRDSYWTVNWSVYSCTIFRSLQSILKLAPAYRRKPQQKKHKTWDGDAFLSHEGDTLTLISEKGVMWVDSFLDRTDN